MAVNTTTNRIQYNGNGSTTAFSFPYKFFANSDLVVIKTSSLGVDTTLAITTDYTVTGAGLDAGGTITTVVAPASGERLTIYRNMPNTQTTVYNASDPFPAKSHENALDRAMIAAQQNKDALSLTVKIPVSDPTTISTEIPNATTRANKFLGFDANGNFIAGTVGTISIEDGDITTAKIADNAVTLAKMQQVATNTLLGRATAGTGNVEALTIGTGLQLTGTTISTVATGTTDLSDVWLYSGI